MGDHRLSEQIKLRWHQACFKLVSAPTDKNSKHRAWVPTESFVSLKEFARKLAKDGDGLAKEWLNHKSGSLNQPRSDANVKAAREACAASKLARRKSKSGSSTPAKETKGAKGKAAKGV